MGKAVDLLKTAGSEGLSIYKLDKKHEGAFKDGKLVEDESEAYYDVFDLKNQHQDYAHRIVDGKYYGNYYTDGKLSPNMKKMKTIIDRAGEMGGNTSMIDNKTLKNNYIKPRIQELNSKMKGEFSKEEKSDMKKDIAGLKSLMSHNGSFGVFPG